MPLRNRVTPWSAIEADPARGIFTGNRGCLVREAGVLATDGWRTKAWICCVTDWRGRKRAQMQPGVWTNLYFLDEAVALSAGHRPCAYCRRGDYNRFMAAWAAAFPREGRWLAREVDEVLHAQRTEKGGQDTISLTAASAGRFSARKLYPVPLFPDGALVERAPGEAWLWSGGRLRRWSHGGYGAGEAAQAAELVRPITPPAMLAVLAAGYGVVLHPTAG